VRHIRGKRVLITGAAAGIGRALAVRFAQEGAALHLVDIDETGLKETVRQVQRHEVDCSHTTADLAVPQHIDRTVTDVLVERDGVDVLINNAGITYYGPTVRMTSDQWERLLAVNYLAPIRLTQRLLPTLLANAESHIVNVSSIYGFLTTSRCVAYHATKFGLAGFSDALRMELSRYGLGVTTLCPGFVRTNIYQGALRHKADRRIPTPPKWLTVSTERVAEEAVRAVRRNRRLAMVGLFTRFAYHTTRLFPGFLDLLYRFQRRRHYSGHTSPRTPDLPEALTAPTMQTYRPSDASSSESARAASSQSDSLIPESMFDAA